MVAQRPASLDRVFHALADPTRRAVLHHLASGQRNITELAAPFDMSFVAASKHVRMLERAGLVRRRIVGRSHVCRLEPAPLAAATDWLRFYERLWTMRLDALDTLLRAEDLANTAVPERKGTRTLMRISLTSLMVDDQAKAQAFYTDVLGFVTKQDVPMGEDRWLTVVSPDDPDGVQLALEPVNNPTLDGFALRSQQGLHDKGIPATAFEVDDIQQEFERLQGRGVTFTREPTPMGPVTIAILDDTRGNLIQIYQV